MARVNYAKLAKAMNARTYKRKRRRTFAQRNYPASDYYQLYVPRTDMSRNAFGTSWRSATDVQKANRKNYRMMGRGGYKSILRKTRSGLRWGAGMADAMGPQGAQAAHLLRAAAGRGLYMGGRGDYIVDDDSNTATNSLIGGSIDDESPQPPMFETIADETGALMVTHRETIQSIYGNPSTTDFVNVTFSLNPGLTRTFPFLSQIAANFEEYEFVQLMFSYIPQTNFTLNSEDGQTGSVYMYTDYNAFDRPKRSPQEMIQSYGTTKGRALQRIEHGIECDPKKLSGDGHNFVRVRGLAENEPITKYDHGLFQLAVDSTPSTVANQIIGTLQVTYKILLRKPRCFSLYGYNNDNDEFIIEDNNTNLQGATLTSGEFNSLNCLITTGDQAIVGSGDSNDGAGNYAGGDGFITITFPTWFSGPVEITGFKDVASGTLGNSGDNTPRYGGRVEKIFLPSTTYGEGNDGIAQSWRCSGDEDTEMFQCQVEVQQAKSGQDNQVQLRTRWGGSGNTRVVLKIQRTNNFEQLTPQQFS